MDAHVHVVAGPPVDKAQLSVEASVPANIAAPAPSLAVAGPVDALNLVQAGRKDHGGHAPAMGGGLNGAPCAGAPPIFRPPDAAPALTPTPTPSPSPALTSSAVGSMASATACLPVPAPASLVFALLASPLPGPHSAAAVLRRRVLADLPHTTTSEVEALVSPAGLYRSGVVGRHLVRCDRLRRTLTWSLAAQGAMRRWDRAWAVEEDGEGACLVSLTQALQPANSPPAPFDAGLLEESVRRQTAALVLALADAAAAAVAASQPPPPTPIQPALLSSSSPPSLPAWVHESLPPAGADLLAAGWASLHHAAVAIQPAAAALVTSTRHTVATGPLADGAAWAARVRATPAPSPLLLLWWALAFLTGVDAAVRAAHGGHARPPARARATWAALEALRTGAARAGLADDRVPPPPPPCSPHWLARPLTPAPPAAAAALASHPVARRPRREEGGSRGRRSGALVALPLEKRWHRLAGGEGGAARRWTGGAPRPGGGRP